MTGKGPDDLVAPFDLVGVGGAGQDLLVNPVDVFVVVANGFADCLRHDEMK